MRRENWEDIKFQIAKFRFQSCLLCKKVTLNGDVSSTITRTKTCINDNKIDEVKANAIYPFLLRRREIVSEILRATLKNSLMLKFYGILLWGCSLSSELSSRQQLS